MTLRQAQGRQREYWIPTYSSNYSEYAYAGMTEREKMTERKRARHAVPLRQRRKEKNEKKNERRWQKKRGHGTPFPYNRERKV